MMSRWLVFFLFLIFVTSCSTRVDYDCSPIVDRSFESTNINTASIEELEKLPHIGLRTAESIVAFRNENGPFRRVEHLMLIKGVSEKRFAELRPLLRTE